MLRRSLATADPPLRRCDANATRMLWISYQAGRGVCIDWATQNRNWSGFAFITVNDASGTEIARAEWTGGGALNGRQLIHRFVADLAQLRRRNRQQL
jgi:hypothetical protein